MSGPAQFPATLQQAIAYFADSTRAHEAAVALRWPNGITCPRCGSDKHSAIPTRHLWRCHSCKKQFSLKVGTIFEDSPLSMDKWMAAAWMLVNCRNGISSYELARGLGITQKSAWFMLHRIRRAMQTGTFEKMGGTCEADETYIGGKARNMHAAKRAEKITGNSDEDKTIVMGVLERTTEAKPSQVKLTVLENRKKKAVQAEVRKHVRAGAAIYTDALKSYEGLDEYQHAVIDHAVAYVDGQVHTNGMENFWSLLKRGLRGTYVSVEPFHLFRYLDEQAFRYNNRQVSDAERFWGVMANVAGKRLTYRQVTGKQPGGETCVN